jgi:hypothetical protein
MDADIRGWAVFPIGPRSGPVSHAQRYSDSAHSRRMGQGQTSAGRCNLGQTWAGIFEVTISPLAPWEINVNRNES